MRTMSKRPLPSLRCLSLAVALGLAWLVGWTPSVGQAQGNESSATYRVTFKGTWTTAATPGGVPSGAHFTTLIGATHNSSVTFWQAGGAATSGIEAVAELGSTSTFRSEINASSHAGTIIQVSGGGSTFQNSVDFEASKTYPLVTLISMVAPSPDWFVGVSGLSLVDGVGNWRSQVEVNLYPYDAGTEDGSGFSLSNPATVPQGTIASIRGTDPFTNERLATLTFVRNQTGGPGEGGNGGGTGGGGSNGGEDRRPQVTQELGARMLAIGRALKLDLSAAFRSRDGSALTFSASSSDPSVATASVEDAELTVRGQGEGMAEIAATATDASNRSLTQRFKVMVTAPEAVWRLPQASDPALQGFVRVINRSNKAGEVMVKATDDAGVAYDPLTLSLGAHAAAHFNSNDLEAGNAAKGLAGGTGPGTGGWRLQFQSEALDVEALGYVRTTDGFVTAMEATAPRGADGALGLATFNPASNTNQVSVLRLLNPADVEAAATVTGVDDSGASPGTPVALTLPAGSACEVDAAELESGRGLACGEPQAGLGDGAGKWRLSIASESPLMAMGLLRSPTGHLSNLSGTASADADGVWHAPLFPAANDPDGRQGFVRVVNRSTRAGTVTIQASDDSDAGYGDLSLRLDAGEARHVNSDDLELGNASKGLSRRTGAGSGTWRLALSGTGFDFGAHAHVRHRDGFLTAMQAVAPSQDGVHRVATFNPGSNTRQVSVLRIANRGRSATTATVTGADDGGVRPGGPVEVQVPGGAAVELTAAELESGEAAPISSGALGDGVGKWRLRVESEGDLAVMSLLKDPNGRLANLSGADGGWDFGPLPSLLPPPSTVTAEGAGHRRMRATWSEVPGARYGVDLLRDGTPVEGRSLQAAARTDFRWSDLEPGTYAVRVRSVDIDGHAGPWSAPSNAVMVR